MGRPLLSDRAWLAVTVVVLAVYDVLRRTSIPDGADLFANTAMIGVVGLLACGAGLTRRELGLERRQVPAGLRLGLSVLALVALVVTAALAVSDNPLGLVADRTDLSGAELLFQVFVEIPIATVVMEELAFRGLVSTLTERVARPRTALVWSALLFGVWHLVPAWPGADAGRLAGAFGIVAATAVAGAVLQWMKRRSGSIVAPMIAHWATNGVGLALVWLMAR